MVMASLGGIVESLLGVHISTSTSPRPSLPLLVLSTLSHDPRALTLRRLHVQVLSVSNTISRLLIGLLSDWLSYAAAPIPEAGLGEGWTGWCKRRLHRKPQVSRLAFLVAACGILVGAFGFTAVGMERTDELWVLSVGQLSRLLLLLSSGSPVLTPPLATATGFSYGLIFTLAPAIVRVVYPLPTFGRNWGLLTWFSALGALLFTPLFGIMLDAATLRQGNERCVGRECYEGVFGLSAASAAVALGVSAVLWRGWWRGKV